MLALDDHEEFAEKWEPHFRARPGVAIVGIFHERASGLRDRRDKVRVSVWAAAEKIQLGELERSYSAQMLEKSCRPLAQSP